MPDSNPEDGSGSKSVALDSTSPPVTGTQKTAAPEQELEARRPVIKPFRILMAMMGVALLINYVETMVIPGIPTIQKDFATTATIASWITSAFLIVGSAVSPLFGKLGDIYGKKRTFLLALGFYTFGVAIAGFSPSIYFLLFSRAVQGIGFAITPLALAIVTDVYPREKAAQAQGIISGSFAIGAAMGLVLGSYVVEDLGWEYAFHTAFVLSLVLFAIVVKVLTKDTPRAGSRAIDYAGAAILMAGVTLTLVYLTEGPALGWLSFEEFAFLIPGLALTTFFFFFEARKKYPLIQLRLLRIRNVLIANLIGLIAGVPMFLLFFALVYYMQLPTPFGLGLDIIAVGLALAPSTVGMMVVGPLIGRVMVRVGPRPVLVLASALSITGLALFTFNRATSFAISIDMIVSLAGIVSTLVPLVNMIAISLPPENIAVGLGMNIMLRNIGGAIGPVVATTIMASYTAPLIQSIGGHPTVVAVFPSAVAFNYVFGVGIAMVAINLALSLVVKNYTFKGARTQEKI